MYQDFEDDVQEMMQHWSEKLQGIHEALCDFAETVRIVLHEPTMKLLNILSFDDDYIEFQSLPTLIGLLRDYRQQLREATHAKDRQVLDRVIIMLQFAHRGTEPYKTNARVWLENAGIRYEETD